MENKEQNTGMSLDEDYPISIREFMYEEFCKKFPNQETTNLSLFQVFKLGFRSGNKWQSSQPINSGWVKIDSSLPSQIPDEDVWTYWFQVNRVVFVPKGEYVPLGVVSHYMLLVKPQPPKQ